MDTEENISLIKLMNIGLIRKNIIKNIKSCSDIGNLAKTCHKIKFLIQNDKIRKNIIWYKDVQRMYVKNKENILEDQQVSKLDDIEFRIQYHSENTLSDINECNDELINEEGIICIRIHNMIQNIEEKDLFYKKIVEEINLNCHTRKDGKILDFLVIYNDNNYMTLPILSLMSHENITCIELLINVFLDDSCNFNQLDKNIFEGFPNFHKLLVWGTINEYKYNKLENNTTIVEYILCELSKRKNPRIVLLSTYDSHHVLIKYLNLFFRISSKYGVKVIYKVVNIFPLTNEDYDSPFPIEECDYFSPILNNTTCIFNRILTCRNFYFTTSNLQNFLNLQKLVLNFNFFDINKGLQRMEKLYSPILSLKSCKNLKMLTLAFDKYINQKVCLKVQMFSDNLKYLVSIMPPTVERLDINYGFTLTKDITEAISQCMPNIKILQVRFITNIDNDCLSVFKNLKVFIYDQYYAISIPKTVKIVVIKFFQNQRSNNTEVLNQNVMKSYMEKFSVCLQSTMNDFIFFNDITSWDRYKHIIQDPNRT
uniref:ANK_REP_REGION domain-containing protein n=1 Tax=Strongyloides venezuelensis TaxID=75913 RepID=A0A0K0FP95_STRVS